MHLIYAGITGAPANS